MTHPVVNLGSVVTIKGGGTPARKVPDYWHGEIPWATVKDLKSHELGNTQEAITVEGLQNSASNLIPAGTVVTATRMALGRAAITEQDLAINQDLKALFCNGAITAKYLLHFLNANKSKIESMGKGATVKGITLDVLLGLKIPLPPLEEQKRIAAILDKADAIRKKRKQAIELTEQFLRSAFLDMFGDPVFNRNKHPFIPLFELSDGNNGIKCGPFGTQLGKHEFTSKGVPLWGIKHVNRHFSLMTHEFVSDEKARELGAYRLTAGDVVMTRKGTIGNASVYPEGFEDGVMHSDLLRLRVNTNKCSPLFLSFQFALSRDVEHQIARVSSGAVMAGINVSKLKEVSVIVPPISQQRQFESLVIRQKGLQMKLMNSQGCGRGLFKSLQQRAFRGKL